MSKKKHYALQAESIKTQGGTASDIDRYLNEVCEKEKPVSVVAFKAAIVLAMLH